MPCQENFRVNLLLFSFSAGLRNTVDVHWLRLNMDNINNSNEIPDYIDYKRWEWFHWIAVKNVHMPYCLWTCRYCVHIDLCNTGVVLYQLSKQANWDLVIMLVPNKPSNWWINNCNYVKITYVNVRLKKRMWKPSWQLWTLLR